MPLAQKLAFFNFFLLLFYFVSCNVGSSGFQQKVASRPLSLNDSNLRTCVFDPGYSVVHFPMYHNPPQQQGLVANEDYERVAKSQFQLLHTLLDYNRSYRKLAVFEESIVTDVFNENYITQVKQDLARGDTFTRLDGTQFFVANERIRARQLFQSGFPAFYEQMIPEQKRVLWDLGAVLTLYLLEEIPRIYKVIDLEGFNLVRAQLGYDFSDTRIQQNPYWVFTYREQKLRTEIQNFYIQNPSWGGLVFIVYGKNHDFSDDFTGYPFQSGHSFCLGWDRARTTAAPSASSQ